MTATARRAIEDVYPLSPVQQAMLFETLAAPAAGVYVQQFLYRVVGDLEPAAIRRAWETVVARHPALRTAFIWKDQPRPLQAVLARVELPWSEEDLRALDPAAQRARVDGHLAEVSRAGFPLVRAPQVRLVACHQQYMAKNPNGYCGLGGTASPAPLGCSRRARRAR